MKNNFTNLLVKDLKIIAKSYKLKQSGKKNDIIDRIINHLNLSNSVILIQKYFRRFFIQNTIHIRTKACLNRKLCNNTTDPISLENIEMIHPFLFVGIYSENKLYGFNIISIIEMMKTNTKKIINPYNRCIIDYNTIKNILTAYRHSIILTPKSFIKPDQISRQTSIKKSRLYTPYGVSLHYFYPVAYSNNLRNTDIYNKICQFRNLNLEQRIFNLFMEFDRLGNYTQGSWFSNLTARCYPKFYRCLLDIWKVRANLQHSVKIKICQLFDPFQEDLFNNRFVITRQLPLDNERILFKIKLCCICAMESLTFTGIDEDYCKIGATYCIMALTTVSQSARVAFPWLYESIVN